MRLIYRHHSIERLVYFKLDREKFLRELMSDDIKLLWIFEVSQIKFWNGKLDIIFN